jgi:sugar/nucleoside kinase (ribokinase family)
MVLVDPVAFELDRLGALGAVDHLDASGDFFDFRHYNIERFEGTMRWLNTAFIGWPGALDDPTIDGVRDVVRRSEKLAVITLGSRGVQVIDGRGASASERFIPVNAVEVTGTTVGCGDAFIAAFLNHWWRSEQSSNEVDAAVAAGAVLGAAATAWLRPLPDDAYV